jgi:hypothetical protein
LKVVLFPDPQRFASYGQILYLPIYWRLFLQLVASVADPHHLGADPDPSCLSLRCGSGSYLSICGSGSYFLIWYGSMRIRIRNTAYSMLWWIQGKKFFNLDRYETTSRLKVFYLYARWWCQQWSRCWRR